MLKIEDKVEMLKGYLDEIKDNYADTFKTDILFYFNEFEDIQNTNLSFLNTLHTEKDIHQWVDNLTSKIVMIFSADEEQLSDFIFFSLNQ